MAKKISRSRISLINEDGVVVREWQVYRENMIFGERYMTARIFSANGDVGWVYIVPGPHTLIMEDIAESKDSDFSS